MGTEKFEIDVFKVSFHKVIKLLVLDHKKVLALTKSMFSKERVRYENLLLIRRKSADI